MRTPTALAASKVKAFLLCRHLTSALLVRAATMGPAFGQVPPARLLSEDASESCAVAQAADATDEELATRQAKPPAPPTASRLFALVGRASACQRPLAGHFFTAS